MLDPQTGSIVLSNHMAQSMFEYSAMEMEKLTLNDLTSQDEQQTVMNQLLKYQSKNDQSHDDQYKQKSSLDSSLKFSGESISETSGLPFLQHIPMRSKDNLTMICDIRSSFVEIEGMTFILTVSLAERSIKNQHVLTDTTK